MTTKTLATQKKRAKQQSCTVVLAAAFVMLATSALALTPSEIRGRTFARNNCGPCHSLDKASPSPLPIAPPFRTLGRRYPIESLAESLAAGVMTGHPTMPTFQLDPDQINDLLSFMTTLQQ